MGALVVTIGTALYLAYAVRRARQGKEPSAGSLDFMLALGVGVRWLFLIVMPVFVVALLLMGRLAPAALSAVPVWIIPAIIFAVPLVVIAWTLHSLRRARDKVREP